MTDFFLLLNCILLAVVLLITLIAWLRHTPALLWMSVLRPWIVMPALALSAALAYGLTAVLFQKIGASSQGILSLRFVSIVFIVPWPARQAADLAAWLRDGASATQLPRRSYIFAAARRDQQEKFVAGALD